MARFAEVPAVVGDTAKPDVDDDGDGGSDVAVVAELTNPTIAEDLAALLGLPGNGLAFLPLSCSP